MRRETEMEMASRLAREAVAREIAELDRRAEVTPARRVRRTTAPSIVYSIRLDPAEVELLEQVVDEVRSLIPTRKAGSW